MDDPTLEAASKHIQAGDMGRAADLLREAVQAGPGRTDESRGRYFTHVMNLGDLLVYLEHYEEAERVLRTGLQGRADLYGRDHPGYAYGLEPLAEALLRAGQAKQALPLAEQATEIFWNHTHERTPEVMVLRAFARLAVDDEANAFQDMEALPDDLVEVAIETTVTRAERDPSLGKRVLAALLGWMDQHERGAPHRDTVLKALG